MCRGTSGSLLRVEHIMFIDLNIIKTMTKHPILRVDAKKGIFSMFFLSDYLGKYLIYRVPFIS